MPGVGVDVVDLARIAESVARAPGRLAARLCTEAELAWIADGDEVERLAALFALKEAWIKAQGGRPRGFRWQDCEYTSRGTFAGMPSLWVNHRGVVTARVGEGRASHMTQVPIDVAPDGLTARELAYCNGSPQRIAGRVAAKQAVAVFVPDGTPIEILPGEHPADEPLPCRGSHPPQVVVADSAWEIEVSIAHGDTVAAACAWIT